MKKVDLTKYLVIASVILICSGCSTSYTKTGVGGSRMAQSHFTYPNSNVIPLGQAKGEAHRTGDMKNFPSLGDAMREAMDKAVVSKSGADLLINAETEATMTTASTTRWWVLLLGVPTVGLAPLFLDIVKIDFTYDVTVTGTAAKMEVGKNTALH